MLSVKLFCLFLSEPFLSPFLCFGFVDVKGGRQEEKKRRLFLLPFFLFPLYISINSWSQTIVMWPSDGDIVSVLRNLTDLEKRMQFNIYGILFSTWAVA